MAAIPPTGPVPTRGVVNIWGLTPATGPNPIASELRLTGNFAPSSQTFPASSTSRFPLSKFLGLSYTFSTTLTSTTPGQSWVAPVTGTCTIFLVAGGGAGGMGATLPNPSGGGLYAGGGGGGGGGVILTTVSVTKGTSYPYSIGAGGVSQANPVPSPTVAPAPPGTPTIFNGNPVYTAIGGGGGAAGAWPYGAGIPGGSGGGGAGGPAPSPAAPSNNSGGTGTPGQGYPGGRVNSASAAASAGGGGAGGVSGTPTGPAPSGYNPQAGGVGYTWPVTGITYSSGGSGAFSGGGASATSYGGGGGGSTALGAPPGAVGTQVRGGNGYQGVIIISYP